MKSCHRRALKHLEGVRKREGRGGWVGGGGGGGGGEEIPCFIRPPLLWQVRCSTGREQQQEQPRAGFLPRPYKAGASTLLPWWRGYRTEMQTLAHTHAVWHGYTWESTHSHLRPPTQRLKHGRGRKKWRTQLHADAAQPTTASPSERLSSPQAVLPTHAHISETRLITLRFSQCVTGVNVPGVDGIGLIFKFVCWVLVLLLLCHRLIY